MGIFDWLKTPDIHKGVEEYKNTPGALLLDVRTGAEYAEGHIPGSVNIPLQFLDEPVAGLDPAARREFLSLIKQLHKQGLTIVMVSHSMDDLAALCDRIVVLKEGQLFTEGTPETVFQQADAMKEVGLGIPASQRLAHMSLLLAHETAHCFGAEDEYNNERPAEHKADGVWGCLVDCFETANNASVNFYEDLLAGDIEPFCDACRSAIGSGIDYWPSTAI